MAIAFPAPPATAHSRLSSTTRATGLTAAITRPALLLLVVIGAAAGFLATSPAVAAAAIANAGPELTHLLRAMAGLKILFAAAAIAVTTWRLGVPVTWPGLATYALATAAMAAGPGLIWQMAHVKAGALLLHAGLLANILLLWRDPATATRLKAAVELRRAALRAG